MNNTYITLLAGSISGLVEVSAIHPLDYYKTIKQTNNKIKINDFVKDIYAKNGIRSFYKGYASRMFGIVPMRTIFWSTMSFSDKYLQQKNINQKYVYLLSGSIAGSLQTLIDCPIESIKTRIMTRNNQQILFSGFTPNLLRNVGFAALFNYQKNSMKINNATFFDNLCIGFVSGITACIVTQPFDFIKTKMQANPKITMRNVIQNNKPFAFFYGLVPRTSITCISMCIGLPVFELINNN
jgi:hypothetical protein